MPKAKLKTPPPRLVGQTKSVGFQVGARKAFNVPPQQAWDFLTSPTGQRLWLGHAPDLKWIEGQTYQTAEGATGEIRVVNPGGHFRLTWQPKGWKSPSSIQVRVIPRNGQTVIAFHHEHLPGPQKRELMRKRWTKVLQSLEDVFGNGTA